MEIDGKLLWQRQLAILRALAPEQLMLAGPERAIEMSSRAERSGVEGSRGTSGKRLSGEAGGEETRRDPSTSLRMTVIADELENAGPLGGVTAALGNCTAPLLVVLAVDLPEMTTAFLRNLLALCHHGKGVVPCGAEFFEPLAAIYPASAAAIAREQLRCGEFSMQQFVRAALREDLVVERKLQPAEMSLFANLNTPADL